MASQDEMLRRRGTYDAAVDTSAVVNPFRDHLYKEPAALAAPANIPSCACPITMS